jgi:5-methylcytosine-specific restriction endonuclease McrA
MRARLTEEEKKERKRNCDRRYNLNNKERVAYRKKKYQEEHRDIANLSSIKYRENNKDKVRERTNSWRSRNPEMAKLQVNRRRSLRYDNESFRLTGSDIKRAFNMQIGRCFWCDKKLQNYHVDHIIPIGRGGRHSIGNIVISCPSCNSIKSNKLPVEFKIYRNIKF